MSRSINNKIYVRVATCLITPIKVVEVSAFTVSYQYEHKISYFGAVSCIPTHEVPVQDCVGGDHGPCFSNRRTMYWESLVYELTKVARKDRKDGLGLELDIAFLTSYHAAGRHDGAGMIAKCMHTWWSLENNCTGDGAVIRDLINNRNVSERFTKSCFSMVAYLFTGINYGSNVFAAVNGTPASGKDYNCRTCKIQLGTT